MFDYLIVGAGFAGCVAAERLARVHNQKVLLIDKRPHLGGNAYDVVNEHGVLIHQYGPHIFHTRSPKVWNYLSKFTAWRPYTHRVLTSVNGMLLPIPINRDTINRLLGTSMDEAALIEYFASVAEPCAEVRTSEDVIVSRIGRELYELFFRNYTRKQWGLDPSELDASVIARVPVRTDVDDRYFIDEYQAMPRDGYTRMFERMVDHPNITIQLDTEHLDVRNDARYRNTIFTGPVDEYFGFRHGALEYRSLQFRFETHECERLMPAAVVNYPNEHDWTRVTEFKYLTGQQHSKTTIVYEYPCAQGDPYYPVPREVNKERYLRYRTLAETCANVYFTGRLGTYRYYNMDQVVAQSLALCARLMGESEPTTISAV